MIRHATPKRTRADRERGCVLAMHQTIALGGTLPANERIAEMHGVSVAFVKVHRP